MISELVPLVAKSIAKNINITFNAAPHVALIEAEPTQLHQMLMILIHNSIKALPNGGEIVVELNQCDFKQGVEQEGTTQICCSCHRNIIGNFVELAIGDNGQGITQKNIQKLFLPFFTTHQMDGGTGMGLSVLHGMLHEHHGHVLISSEPEQGAKFSLLFPVYEQINAIDDVIHNEVVNRDNLDKAHILLVDDEQIVVDLLAELLTFSGYQISAHTNVQSALAMFMAAPETFDLLITDQNMAGLTGLMLARAIKQVRIDLPAILISGKPVDNFADDINFIESIDGFLTKPFKTKQLNTLVEKLIKDNSSAK